LLVYCQTQNNNRPYKKQISFSKEGGNPLGVQTIKGKGRAQAIIHSKLRGK